MTRCGWCLSEDHLAPFCPTLPPLRVRDDDTEERASQEDAFDQLRMWTIAERTAKGQYRRLLIEAGITIPPEVEELDPDRGLYA